MDTMYRVYNKCNFDIGITLPSGQKPVILKGSFFPMSANDILYVESTARRAKPFSSKKLVATTPDNKEVTLEEIGGFTDPYVEKHLDEEEIMLNLKKPNKAVESWLKNINDPIELDAIREVAVRMDVAGSKLKLIQARIPNKDILESDE